MLGRFKAAVSVSHLLGTTRWGPPVRHQQWQIWYNCSQVVNQLMLRPPGRVQHVITMTGLWLSGAGNVEHLGRPQHPGSRARRGQRRTVEWAGWHWDDRCSTVRWYLWSGLISLEEWITALYYHCICTFMGIFMMGCATKLSCLVVQQNS